MDDVAARLGIVSGALNRYYADKEDLFRLKVVIAEARNFRELARIWHDQLMAPTVEVLAGAIAAAQARGEARVGDPRGYAFQLTSPLVTTLIWRETLRRSVRQISNSSRSLRSARRFLRERCSGRLFRVDLPRGVSPEPGVGVRSALTPGSNSNVGS